MAAAPQVAGTAALPPAVEAVGRHAEDAYDVAKAGTWTTARVIVDSLKRAVSTLPAAAQSAVAPSGALHAEVATLDQAVTDRNHVRAERAANHITALGAQMAAQYLAPVPANVVLLDYYGRELEIWSTANDRTKLRDTALAMSRTWGAVRPQVIARGGNAEATRFDALVSRAEGASTVAAYARLATPVLDEVDRLEAVFTR
ncbi:MAG TPA: hypothetical protein VG432_14500 [Gemmatimonadaceae bacterium]|nr:hypothetical protein [Gemmatimonadaceae bacterium]